MRGRRLGGDETLRVSAHGMAWGLEENEGCKVSSACLSCHVCVACVVECI